MTKLTDLVEQKACEEHYQKVKEIKLEDVVQQRGSYTIDLEGLQLDLTRTHVSNETIRLLLDLAQAQNLERMRDHMFEGERINNTEARAVLHTALRAGDKAPHLFVEGQDVRACVSAMHAQMEDFVKRIRSGAWLGATGKPIKHVVNIGIGGSDLGPRLGVSALRDFASGPNIYYVANVDAVELIDVCKDLDPAETLFIVVSKSFTTQETLMNARTARTWIVSALGEGATANHFVAVSAACNKAEAFGIDVQNIFPLWDWIGGRHSVWSSVGLSVALSIGWDHYKAFLAGAAMMDHHFQTAALDQNMPVLLAMISLWYRNFWGTCAEAVLPYCERLRELPRFLQQLNMESNGKSVTREGQAVDYQTAPLIFGECGTIGQHSFHQWLHQGTGTVLSEFIGIKKDAYGRPEHHTILNAHLNAQMCALQTGRAMPDFPAQTNPGNKPSVLVWMDVLDPYHLGMLLALYEHSVFVQGVIWDLNSFDQYGVELGKTLAEEALST